MSGLEKTMQYIGEVVKNLKNYKKDATISVPSCAEAVVGRTGSSQTHGGIVSGGGGPQQQGVGGVQNQRLGVSRTVQRGSLDSKRRIG